MASRTSFRFTTNPIQVAEQLDPYWVKFYNSDNELISSFHEGEGKYRISANRGEMYSYEINPDLISSYTLPNSNDPIPADDISAMLNKIIDNTNFNESETSSELEIPDTSTWYDSQIDGDDISVDYYFGSSPNYNARQLNPAGVFITSAKIPITLYIWSDEPSIRLVDGDGQSIRLTKTNDVFHYGFNNPTPVKVVRNVL